MQVGFFREQLVRCVYACACRPSSWRLWWAPWRTRTWRLSPTPWQSTTASAGNTLLPTVLVVAHNEDNAQTYFCTIEFVGILHIAQTLKIIQFSGTFRVQILSCCQKLNDAVKKEKLNKIIKHLFFSSAPRGGVITLSTKQTYCSFAFSCPPPAPVLFHFAFLPKFALLYILRITFFEEWMIFYRWGGGGGEKTNKRFLP
jgi:hypothetical protein